MARTVTIAEMLDHLTDLLKGSWRYATGLRGFLAVQTGYEESTTILTSQLQNRDESFLRVLELGIYGNHESPYRRLLLHAGFQFEHVHAMVHEEGLEATLTRLHDAGVYVTLEEFKGRTPVRRPDLEFGVTERDFDNPLLTAHYMGSTGGSRGGGTRVPLDFDFLAYESLSWACHLNAQGIVGRPSVLWLGQPPSPVGLRSLFQFARIGRLPNEWFAPNKPSWNRQGIQGRALTAYTILTSYLSGRPVPRPRFLEDESAIVEYLARATERGSPAVVVGLVSPAVRVCLAAENAGADIRGTVFLAAGEPYTNGNAAVFERVGTRCVPTYAMQEAGAVSRGCGAPAMPDDMHIMTEKLALIQRPCERGGLSVQALFFTSLLPNSPKLMLNVETGDYGTVEERDCGCIWEQLGFTTHISGVRSYEKLTSESVTFMGSMLFELLEETLPARFGGSPTDYQIVEEEEHGLPRVSLLVSPRLGQLDEDSILETVFDQLAFADWSRRMSDQWRHSRTLRLQRREPYATPAAKILPLHVLDSQSSRMDEPRQA